METKKTLLKISFFGSKVLRVREIEGLINTKNYKRAVEVFGGSCCISNNLKYHGIVQQAVANDYDKYFKDFETKMDIKDELIEKLNKLGFTKQSTKSTLSEAKIKQLQKLIAPFMDNKKLVLYYLKILYSQHAGYLAR